MKIKDRRCRTEFYRSIKLLHVVYSTRKSRNLIRLKNVLKYAVCRELVFYKSFTVSKRIYETSF